MLIPTWLVLIFWFAAAYLTVTGASTIRSCSRRSPAASSGCHADRLTIMQHAFAGGGTGQG